MLLGLTIGLVVAGYVYVSDVRAPASGPAATASRARSPSPSPQQATAAANPAATASRAARLEAPAAEPAAAAAAAAAQAPGERFDFYEILPQTEVAVSEPAETETSAARTAPAGDAPGSYVLQAGSFRTHADADRRKASIAFLGYESHIQRATVDDEVVHRVLIGPIGTAGEVANARRRLRDANIDTLVMQASE